MDSIKTIGSYTAMGFGVGCFVVFGVGCFVGFGVTVKSMSDTRWPNIHPINNAS
jgi:hypothetical protein